MGGHHGQDGHPLLGCAKIFFLSDLEISQPPEIKMHRRKGELFKQKPGCEENGGVWSRNMWIIIGDACLVPHIFFKLILCTNSWYLLIRTCHVICLPKSQPMHGLSEVGLDFPYMQRIIRETGSVGRVTESLIQSSLCMCIHLFISFRIYYCGFSLTWCSRATSTSLSIVIHTRPLIGEEWIWA